MVNYLALAGERSRAPKKKTRLKKKHQDAGHEELS
jgi:hypothetical protein